MPERQPTSSMPDPFTGWLSDIGAYVALAVSIFAGLARILRDTDNMLGSVLSMCNRVRVFRQGLKGETKRLAQAGQRVLAEEAKQPSRSTST